MVYIPEVVRSDTGLQYDSAEFAKFAKTGNLNALLAAPSMLNPTEKLNEQFKQ